MIACVCLAYFAASVERRAKTHLAHCPLILGGQPWASDPLYGFSQEAAGQGVRPGMALRQAHLLFPSATFMDATPPQYAAAAHEVHECLADFARRVEQKAWWQGTRPDLEAGPALGRRLPAIYWLDMGALPEREVIPLAQQIGRTLREATHLEPSLGLAEQGWTAQVAAALSRPGHLLPVADGHEKSFLADRSLQFLPLETKLRHKLLQLGIQTLGQLTTLPLAALQERFGPAIVPVYRLAEGQAATAMPSTPEEAQLTLNRLFPEPLDNLLDLQAVVAQMAAALSAQLQTRCQMVHQLRLSAETVAGDVIARDLTLRQPTWDEKQLCGAFLHRLAPAHLTAPIARLGFTLAQLAPARSEQLTLFENTRPRPVTPFVLRARYAPHTFQAQLVAPHHPLPEQRFVWYAPSL
jgi:nucleotidyltransferase/DNA polymerase involved in DNA repair